MRTVSSVQRRVGMTLVAFAATASSVVAFAATPAWGASTQGTLLVRGSGALYSPSGATIDAVVRPGASASFSLQVKNTGPSLAQYRVKIDTNTTDPETLSLKAASVEVSSLALSADGYVTSPIAAGKTLILPMKVTTPTTTPDASPRWINTVTLFDLTNTQQLAFADTYTEGTSTASTGSPRDEYVTGPGQLPLAEHNADSFADESGAPAMKVGSSATFTAKVSNHSATPAQSYLELHDFGSCNAVFAITVKSGATNITSPVEQTQTYLTPVMAPGKTLTFTFGFKLVTAPTACAGECCGYFFSGFGVQLRSNLNPSDYQEEFIILNYAA
jgi:hypothetical protein